MQHHIQTLVKHIFHKESLQEVTINQLQQFIDDYPYSAVGQLLLAKKLRDTGAQNFDEQGGKASLYFHDPVWAGWVLRQDSNGNTETNFDELFRGREPVSETPHFVFNNIPAEEPSVAPEVEETPPWKQQEEETIEPIGATEPVIEQVAEAPPPVEAENEQTSEPEATTSQPETPAPAEGQSYSQPTAETPQDDLSFEPYHTIDYFASLGIKLKPEDLAKDKLGQQLKSFTDWLRTMKKVSPTQASEKMAEMDELTSKSIQKIADFSNEAKEIITEAMAEVWAKQGHREKAVAIYEKLSLLNPSKSHYFATRIEALKS